jgi:hypothetical protein
MARVNKLTAITICIFYSDYLVETLANRIHFDEWIIVTCPADTVTLELCRTRGLTVVVTSLCGAAGSAFDSAYTKAAILNSVLSTLGSDQWVLLLDADTILPRNFRRRLQAMELYPRALYGLWGRRDCATVQEFKWRLAIEPWAENILVSDNLLGYFHLFCLNQPNNRYPLFKAIPEMHDDIAFQNLFKHNLRRLLPMTAMHVGPAQVNWAGRVSSKFHDGIANDFLTAAVEVANVLQPPFASCDTVVVVGIDPGTDFTLFQHLTRPPQFIDYYSCVQSRLTPLLAIDACTTKQMLLEAAGVSKVGLSEGLQESTERGHVLAAFKAADVVLFDIELSIESLVQWLDILCSCQGKELRIIGRFYGFPRWIDITVALNVLFGLPKLLDTNGTWQVQLASLRVPCNGELSKLRLLDSYAKCGIVVLGV